MIPKSEREFLHALATPLSTAIILVDTLVERIEEKGALSIADASELKVLMTTLNGLRELMKDRQHSTKE